MFLKRLMLVISCLVFGLVWAVTAQAKPYSLTGGGGQLQIGGGLPLPIQLTNPRMNLLRSGIARKAAVL